LHEISPGPARIMQRARATVSRLLSRLGFLRRAMLLSRSVLLSSPAYRASVIGAGLK
jgi:hypothetical protein